VNAQEIQAAVAEEFRHLAQKIASCQSIWTALWHGTDDNPAMMPLLALVQQQHRRNFDLWHEEDKARDPGASDTQIATVKRAIDKFNQQRNDLVEKLDDHIFAALQRQPAPAENLPWNSETPGSVIDKLSILSLKVFHMREQTERLDATPEHIRKCTERLQILTRQHADLTTALQALFDDLFGGRKQMKLYRQFKMYNDPESNPKIYGAKQP
jgi:thiol-disulfide isomerase/thioredoxin